MGLFNMEITRRDFIKNTLIWGGALILSPGPLYASEPEEQPWHPAYVGLEKEGKFLMWYGAQNPQGHDQICLAFSDDGIKWQRYEGNPVIPAGDNRYSSQRFPKPRFIENFVF